MQYVITAHCAQFSVMFPDGRRGRQLMFKGQLVPATATPQEIQHHLSINAIRAVAGQAGSEPAPQEPVTTADPVADPGAAQEPEPAEPETPAQEPEPTEPGAEAVPEPDKAAEPADDDDTKWQQALAKAQQLHKQEKAPDGRHSPLVVGAWLTLNGYDRAAVEKAERDELLALVNNLAK